MTTTDDDSHTLDLLRRKVYPGDVVAGARFGSYPDLVTGPVLRITPGGGVRIRVEVGRGGFRPAPGDELLLQPGLFVLLG